MVLQITAEPVPAMWGVRLVATGAEGPVSWSRDDGAADPVPVATGVEVIDRTAPLNQPLVYIAEDGSTRAEADPVTIAATAPILGSLLSPETLPVVVEQYRPLRWEGTSTIHKVLGAHEPYVSVGEAASPSGTLVIRAATGGDRLALVRLLSSGEPMLLRTTCPDRLDTLRFVAAGWEDPFASDGARQGTSRILVDFQTIADVEAMVFPPGWNYNALHAAHATYNEVKASYATYASVVAG